MQLAYREQNAKYITLNMPPELYIPEAIAEKSVAIAGDIPQSLKELNTASVSLASRNALVDYDPDIISLEDLKRDISNAGYDLGIENDRSVEEIIRREFTLLRRRTLASWLFAIQTMCFALGWITLAM